MPPSPPQRLVRFGPVALVGELSEIERQPCECLRRGRAGFLRPAQPFGPHVDPTLARVGVGDREAQHLLGPHSAGQEHAEQGSVPVAAQHIEQVLYDVVRDRARWLRGLLLSVVAAPVQPERLHRIVVGVEPASGP